MSRRSVLPISPGDLRDHADEDRIERIWGRIEHNLNHAYAAPRRRTRVSVLLAAASLCAFAGGIVVGKLSSEAPSRVTIPAPTSADRPAANLFAAGTQAVTYALPGGGEIVLKPGTTVEME